MKRKENEIKANLEKFEEVMQSKKKLPEAEKNKIKRGIIGNSIFLLIILVYLSLLQIGEINIQTDKYVIMLKVLSLILITITIVMFEVSYKRNVNEIIIHSVEILILTFFTLFLVSAYSLYYGSFYKVIITGILVSILYYILKDVIVYIKTKKQYYKSLNDIPTILEK